MRFTFLLLILLLISCNQKEDSTNSLEPLVAYSQEAYDKLLKNNENLKIKIIDTTCINAQKRVKVDMNNGELFYFHTDTWPEWKEMATLLSMYSIELKDLEMSCLRPPKGLGFQNDCYETLMNQEVYKKLGTNTIDSLWNVAERNFVLKYPDSLYMKDGIDVREKYLLK